MRKQRKMKNFRRKCKILEESAMILIFPTEIQKHLFMEKYDNLHHFTKILDKLWDMS